MHIDDEYTLLRRMALRLLGPRAGKGPLDPTDIVHEAYVRVRKSGVLDGDHGEVDVLAYMATTLRSVLVDFVRRERRRDEGLADYVLELRDTVRLGRDRDLDLLALDEALLRLGQVYPRPCQVVEMRFFGGMEMDAIARRLGVTRRTATSDWALARGWLRERMSLV